MDKEYLKILRKMIVNAKKATWKEDKTSALHWLDMAKSFIDAIDYE